MPVRGTPLSLIDWQVLAEVEVASDCDYVDFTGLDINRDWEYYLDAVIKNSGSGDSYYFLFVEGDYDYLNYYTQEFVADGTDTILSRKQRSFWTWLFSGERGLFNIRLTRDPDGYFRWNSFGNRYTGSTVGIELCSGSKTAPVSNITSLRVSADVSGAIGAGSKFILARPRS